MSSNMANGHRERRVKREHRARCRAVKAPCTHCRSPIDYDAPPNHPSSFESDHRIPVVTRPDLAYEPSNLIPSCSRCNRSRGNRPLPTTPWVVADW